MLNSRAIKISFLILVCFLLLGGNVVLADDKKVDPNCPPGTEAGIICLPNPLGIRDIQVPPGQDESVIRILAIIAQVAFFMIFPIGAIAFVALIIGGFYWIFSGGNEERIKKGKDIMIWSLVGILIIFSSYAILSFVIKTLTGG